MTFYSLSFSLRTFSLVRIYGNSCQRSQLTLMGSMRTGRLVVPVCVFKNKKTVIWKPFLLLHHITSPLQSLGRHKNKLKKCFVQKHNITSPSPIISTNCHQVQKLKYETLLVFLRLHSQVTMTRLHKDPNALRGTHHEGNVHTDDNFRSTLSCFCASP